MKIIVSVQAKRSSSHGLVYYIARSKVDPEKEPRGREIFNQHSDQLTIEKANDFFKDVTSRKRISNDELHHLVISLKPEDFDRLGNHEKERKESLREITCRTMKTMQESLNADLLSWAAAIHRNTHNPHVHIAIKKEYFDKNLEKKRLNKIPVSLLPHYEKNGAEKTFAPGLLIEKASQTLDEIILEKEKNRQNSKQNSQTRNGQDQAEVNTNQSKTQNSHGQEQLSDTKPNAGLERESEILARALLAKYYLEKTRENLESLENYGDQRRFIIYDETTKTKRPLSLFDLERRAEKYADRQIKNLKITDSVKKEEIKKKLVESEFQKNADGIKRIKTILHNLVVKENQTLRTRENDYNQIKPLAEKIRAQYKSENNKLPVPDLTPEDLEMLQAHSLEKKDIRTVYYFERVRNELSLERGAGGRTDDQIQSLKAQKMISELKIKSKEKQLKDFDSGKRVFRVEIEGKKWNLLKADALIERQKEDARKVSGKISKVLGKFGLVAQKNNLAKLEEIKAAITENLSAKNEQLKSELKGERAILKTLDNFYKNDPNPEKEMIEAKFNAAELAEIETLAFDLKLGDIYRENWEHQKQFIELTVGEDQNQSESKQKLIAGRSLAREIMSEIEVARLKEENALFKKNKDFLKFEITDQKTGEVKFVSLAEVRFDIRGSLFDQTLEYFLENREKRRTRNALEVIVKVKGIELKEDLKSAQNLLKVTRDFASDYKTKSFLGAVKYLENPVFTPKELMTIELRINQTENKSEAAKLQKILDLADHSKAKNLSAILLSASVENEPSQTIEQSLAIEQKLTVSVVENEKISGLRDIQIRENNAEILNHERGR